MDDKLTTKTVKFTSLGNLYVYGIIYLHGIWFLVRTIAHDLHASVLVAIRTYTYLQKAVIS